MSTYIKGIDTVLANLNKEIEKIEGRSIQGMIKAAIVIRRSMDKTPPLIPVDHGHLRGSYYTDAGHDKQGNPTLEIGFTAMYAWWVHENVGANFNRPGAGAKFLEAALKGNEELILKKIRDNVKIP